MHKVTAKGGTLDGRTYLVPEGTDILDPHPSSPAGRYKVKGHTATWVPNKTTGTPPAGEPGAPEHPGTPSVANSTEGAPVITQTPPKPAPQG